MRRRLVSLLATLGLVVVAAWLGRGETAAQPGWSEVIPGVLRTAGPVAGYALLDDGEALLIDAPLADGKRPGAQVAQEQRLGGID